MRTNLFLFLLLCLGGNLSILSAQSDIPEPTGYVNDFANVISESEEVQILEIIHSVRDKTGGEIAVVTLSDLKGRPINEVALQIGRQWGVGKKGEAGDATRNTGSVILVVPKESSSDGSGHIRVETGTTTNTFVTAGEAGRIADAMIPAFKEQDYGRGIVAGVNALSQEYFEALTPSGLSADVPVESGAEWGALIPLFFILFLLFAFVFIFLRKSNLNFEPSGGTEWKSSEPSNFNNTISSSDSDTSSNSDDSSGFGGGGGFSGGGSSRSW